MDGQTEGTWDVQDMQSNGLGHPPPLSISGRVRIVGHTGIVLHTRQCFRIVPSPLRTNRSPGPLPTWGTIIHAGHPRQWFKVLNYL